MFARRKGRRDVKRIYERPTVTKAKVTLQAVTANGSTTGPTRTAEV